MALPWWQGRIQPHLPAMAGRTEDVSTMIKSILNIVALCAVIALVNGCSSNKTTSPGAMSDSKCCAEKSSCTASKEAAPGAVSDKAECTKVCPMSGKTTAPATEASPGAVSDAKPGCCKSKASTCTSAGAAKVDG